MLQTDFQNQVLNIIKNIILANRLVVENLYELIEKEIIIYPKNLRSKLKNGEKFYIQGLEFENKNNQAQAIHFYKKSWSSLQELKDIGLEILDKDSDGCPDYLEEKFGLNKNQPDTDKDGLTDGFEILQLMNLCDGRSKDTDGNGIPDKDEDPDADGLTNIEEQEAGDRPLDT
ncbi:MAG: hypothetical protein ACOX2G_11760 [Bacillota bacterium]